MHQILGRFLFQSPLKLHVIVLYSQIMSLNLVQLKSYGWQVIFAIFSSTVPVGSLVTFQLISLWY